MLELIEGVETMIIRDLTSNDYLLYKEIRLELLKNNPTNFGSSFQDESKFDDQIWKERLTKPTVNTIGAFIDGKIVGIVVLVRNPRTKMKHIGTINSMYVKPQFRHLGIAQKLIINLKEKALNLNVNRLTLTVVNTNTAAFNLYKKLGFLEYGLEPDVIFYNNSYYSLQIMSLKINRL